MSRSRATKLDPDFDPNQTLGRKHDHEPERESKPPAPSSEPEPLPSEFPDGQRVRARSGAFTGRIVGGAGPSPLTVMVRIDLPPGHPTPHPPPDPVPHLRTDLIPIA